MHIKEHGGMPLIPHLASAKPVVLKDKLALVFPQNALMSKTVASKPGYLDLVRGAIKEIFGVDIPVGCFSDKEVSSQDISSDAGASPFNKLEDLAKKHDVIEILD